MANSKRLCRQCKKIRFRPSEGIITSNNIALCSLECLTLLAIKKGIQSRPKLIKAAVRVAKADLAVRKEKFKPLSEWLEELQKLVNKYVRLRDRLDGCISCPKTFDYSGQWHCSHYISRGASSYLRFNLWNMHKSCAQCNNSKSGNIVEYTPRLIEKIGMDKYNWIIENKSKPVKYNIEYIKRAKRVARKAIKRLEQRL